MRFAILLAIVFLSFAPDAQADEERAYLDTEGPIAEAREKQILAELATLDRSKLADDDWAKEWAGSYYTGDGLGVNARISIAPKLGVAYTWHGCLGLYGANHGEIVGTFPGGVKVQLAVDPNMPGDGFMSSKLYFVRWGNQKYLVPERQMFRLVNSYNRGGVAREHLWGIPILSKPGKGHDGSRPDPGPPGRPELPAEFAKLIIEKPVRLKVTSIEISKQEKRKGFSSDRGELELDGGRNQGLFVGAEIDCDQGERHGAICLVEVNDTKSRGTFYVDRYDVNAPPLDVGTEIQLPGAKPNATGAK